MDPTGPKRLAADVELLLVLRKPLETDDVGVEAEAMGIPCMPCIPCIPCMPAEPTLPMAAAGEPIPMPVFIWPSPKPMPSIPYDASVLMAAAISSVAWSAKPEFRRVILRFSRAAPVMGPPPVKAAMLRPKPTPPPMLKPLPLTPKPPKPPPAKLLLFTI